MGEFDVRLRLWEGWVEEKCLVAVFVEVAATCACFAQLRQMKFMVSKILIAPVAYAIEGNVVLWEWK